MIRYGVSYNHFHIEDFVYDVVLMKLQKKLTRSHEQTHQRGVPESFLSITESEK